MSDNYPHSIIKMLIIGQITEEEIRVYDQNPKTGTRTDFLAQLRAKEAKDGNISDRDMLNHLSNNLYAPHFQPYILTLNLIPSLAGSDTTAISLRACFYYVIKNPRVRKRLVEEIDNADQKGKLSPFITYQECLQLPYL